MHSCQITSKSNQWFFSCSRCLVEVKPEHQTSQKYNPFEGATATHISSKLQEGILSELLCAGLCDTMFTVCSMLIGAFLTGPGDWVYHFGTLMLCTEAVA